VEWSERRAAIAAIAEAERTARGRCLIQTGSAELKPLDFHSFRRAFNTALADIGLNIQTAVRLAGHKNAGTHMRYVMIAETLITPAGAMPKLSRAPALPVSEKARALPNAFSPANETSVFSARASGFEPLTYGSGERW
jgi:integrase